jgi:integrase
MTQAFNASASANTSACEGGVGGHDVRHTFASHLALRGAPARNVQAFLGHASIEMTERYAHLAPDVRHDLIDRLSDDSPARHGNSTATEPDSVASGPQGTRLNLVK